MERTITVTGRGSVRVTPDCARLTFGVQVTGANAQDALRRSNEAMHAIIAAVRGQGVADADLHTTGPNLWPGQQGYTGSNDVAVLVRDLASLGTLIDTVAQASGPDLTMHGVSFSVLDASSHRSEARRLAVESARAVAIELAGAAGAAIGEVISIVEGGGGGGMVPIVRGAMAAKLDMSTPVEAGSHEIPADLTITYRLVDAA